MVRVSKKALADKTKKYLVTQLVSTLAKIPKGVKGEKYLKVILTKSEQTMLAKRLGIIFMLVNKYTWTQITNTLHVSESTIANVSRKMKKGELDAVIACQTESSQSSFWDGLEILIRGGMPEYGKGRWKSLHKVNPPYNKKL